MTTENENIARLLAHPLEEHKMHLGPIEHGEPPYTFNNYYIGVGDIIVADVPADSRGVDSPGFGRLTLVEAEAVRAEIIRRWNEYPRLMELIKNSQAK